ncbi:MAG: cytidylate kinase-like family protein [Deltaproteobacteria bacterium]|nr:cytidylate kinase-like family protein [Deltaproteobacteria bacterium]
MAIITISRGSYSRGKEVAERVAAELGYECLSREVILEASDRYHIPELKMVKAVHDAPSLLERLGHAKQDFIAYYQSALTRAVQKDNVVYHGLAGHVLLKGVPHVLKVRIIADLEDRVVDEMKREESSDQEARSLILRDDQERRKWTRNLYGVDPWDSALYDIVVHIRKFTVSNAVEFICRAARLDPFATTARSQRKIDDLALASQIKAMLVEVHPDVRVTCDYGNVLIYTVNDDRMARRMKEKVEALTRKIQGINHIEVHPGVSAPKISV